MGRLRFSPLWRAGLVACIATLSMLTLTGSFARAEERQASEPGHLGLQDSILADIPDEPVNPMQAISVMLGGGQPSSMAGLLPRNLLSMDSSAVVGSAHPQSSEIDARLAQLSLAGQRERINALSAALALDDSTAAGRFGEFPQPVPQVSIATRPQAAAPQEPAPAGSSKRIQGKTTQAGKPSDQAVAIQATGPPSFRVAETGADPHDPEFRRQTIEELNALLASLPDPEDAGLEGLPDAGAQSEGPAAEQPGTDNELEAYGAIGMTGEDSGFHGLLDFSDGGAGSTESGKAREPGTAVNGFGVKMAIFTVALLLLASFLKGKGNPLSRLSRRSMKVLETVNLGPGRQIMVVETSGANLVLGVTGGGINLLDRIPAESSGEQFRDDMEDIISRESRADEDSWKQRPALDLLDMDTLRGKAGGGNGGRSISVAELRTARAAGAALAPGAVPDRQSELLSRVRRQLERVRG